MYFLSFISDISALHSCSPKLLLRDLSALCVFVVIPVLQMLTRTLESEIMDSADDAREYDAMDHSAVNAQFVTDLLSHLNCSPLQILDLGAGTAQIPIEIAHRALYTHITAVDAAPSMLTVARANITAANLTNRIELLLADAKRLPFANEAFTVVISNSIFHHIPDPQAVFDRGGSCRDARRSAFPSRLGSADRRN